MEKADKTLQTIDRLIALSPNDLSYRALQLNSALKGDLDYEAAKSYLDGLSQLSLEARLWYTSQLASALYRGGRQADAKRLIDEIEDTKVTDVQVLSERVRALTQIGEGRRGRADLGAASFRFKHHPQRDASEMEILPDHVCKPLLRLRARWTD